MSTFKKANVVMLPTTRKAKSITSRVDCYGDFSGYYYKEKLDSRDTKCFCLNIVLSEKIIATTDISLVKEYNLPEPSQSFIQKYIEEYNKGNIITDVLVQYENVYIDSFGTKIVQHKKDSNSYLKQCTFINSILKVNSKDNTITIKKTKEKYIREEVISLCEDAYKVGYGTGVCEETNLGKEVSFKEWLSTSVLDIEPNKIYTKDEVIRLLERFISFLWKKIGIHYPISLGKDAREKFINSEL